MSDSIRSRPSILLLAALIFGLFGMLAGQAVRAAGDQTYQGVIPRRDIYTFVAAAAMGRAAAASPYRYENFAPYSDQCGYALAPFIYPPLALPLLLPLAWLTPAQALPVSLIVNTLAGTIALGLLYLWSRRWGQAAGAALAVVLLALSDIIYGNLWFGQVNLSVLLGIMLFLWSLRPGGSKAGGGVGLGLAIALKIHFLPVLPVLWLRGERRLVLACLATLICLAGVSVLLFPLAWWQDWITIVLPQGGFGVTPEGLGFSGPAAAGNNNWNGVISRLFMDNPYAAPLLMRPAWVPWLGLVGAFAMIGSALAWASFRKRLSLEQASGLMFIAIYLSAPLSWEKHLVFLFPFFIWLLFAQLQRRAFRTFWLTTAALALLLYEKPFLTLYVLLLNLGGWTGNHAYLLCACLPFVLLLAIFSQFFRAQPDTAGFRDLSQAP